MDSENLKEKIEKGAIRCKIILEIAGRPKEKVQEVINEKAESLEKEFKILSKEVAEAKKVGEDFFSAFIEAEILFKDFISLVGFIFDNMPSSIEILEPEKIKADTNLMNDLLNDLAVKLHQYNEAILKLKAMNAILEKKQEKKD